MLFPGSPDYFKHAIMTGIICIKYYSDNYIHQRFARFVSRISKIISTFFKIFPDDFYRFPVVVRTESTSQNIIKCIEIMPGIPIQIFVKRRSISR